MTAPPTTPRPPAVMYLAEPGGRHPAPTRVGPGIAAELEQLHARCLAAAGDATDPGAALVEVTAAGRVRFAGGGGSAAYLDSDLVDAVVHAARAGYRLCLRAGDQVDVRHPCWLPAGHPDGCEHRGWWRWSLLYGYRGPVLEVCTRCAGGHREPAPDDCPHR
jgi:hypothetical protein